MIGKRKILAEVRNVEQLSRWRAYVWIILPLTLLAGLLGGEPLGWRIAVLAIANFLSFAFAFMINEVEDAEDDAKDEARDILSPVARGEMSYIKGWVMSMGVGLLSVFLYAVLGLWVYVVGVVNFVFALMYSWKRIRLKSKIVVDLLSHALILGGFQLLAGYMAFGGEVYIMLKIFLLIVLFSFNGQIYNQLRDLKADREAGLKNTTIVFGKEMVEWLRGLILLSCLAIVINILFHGLIPLYVVGLFMVLVLVTKILSFGLLVNDRMGVTDNLLMKNMIDVLMASNFVLTVWYLVETGFPRVNFVGVLDFVKQLLMVVV